MNRREILARIGALSAAGLIAGPALAQASPDAQIDEVMAKRVWRDPGELDRLVSVAYAFAELRLAYGGPTGVERESKFREVFQGIQNSFGTGAERQAVAASLDSTLSDADAATLGTAMQDRASARLPQLQEWLGGIGVVPDGPLAADIIRAQATFALFGASRLGSGSLAFFDGLCWVYPFC